MKQTEADARNADEMSFEKEISSLLCERILFEEGVFARLPLGIEIYDTEGILHCMNEQAQRIYGVELETVVGKVNLFDSPYIDPQLETRIKAGEEIVLEFEYDFDRMNREYFHTRKKNSIIYEAKIVPIYARQGRIAGYLLLTEDITSVKEAEYRTEESKKNLEMAMEAASMSSWVYDVHKRVFIPLHGNPIVSEGMTLDRLQALLHPQDRTPLSDLFAGLIAGEIQQGKITVRVPDERDGTCRFYESRMRLSTEHRGKLQIVGTQLDVTEKLRMTKRTQDLLAKRELAMQVTDIVHWDFDVRTQKFESFNDPVNDFVPDRLVGVEEYLDVVHPEDQSTVNDALQTMLTGEKRKIDFTCRLQTKYDDTWQYHAVTGVPFEEDEHGDVVRFTGFRQNISKLHRLNEELRERNYKMELTFKTVGMSYWDFDVAAGRFRSFNDPVNDYRSEKPISPEDYLSAAHPDDTQCVTENIGSMLRGESREFTLQYRSRTKWDKEWQTLIVTGLPSERDKKGNVIRYTGIAFNNTKWENMARELKEMKEKAELSDRLKSAFLANMSHEIRTPLNAIVGFSELLVDCDDPQEKKEYWQVIESNNELLLRLINDILDLSKLESGTLELKRERFSMRQLSKELYLMMRQKMTAPDVELLLDTPRGECWIFLDRDRLKQVWMNFLTNAVKCTSSGHIKMGYSVEREGIRFYVEDTGIGIPEHLHDQVFGRFRKLNEFAQGTGLGLAISKAIVEAADGEIGFTSVPGAGSTFWAWVPCKVEIAQEGGPDDPSTPESALPAGESGGKDTKMKILLAEDNDGNYLLVRRILRDYDLTRVFNGLEAVGKLLEEHFDLVFMDMKMPVMDGLEATRRIREFNPDIPIVALTANAFDSDRINALDAGCNAFLTKPVKKSQLLEIFSTKF